MKKSTIGILLMLAAIAVMGFQIGATAKYQDNRYVFLLPIGIALLLIGGVIWFKGIADSRKKD